MRILFIYSSLNKGGIETFFLRISKELANKGISTRFLFLSNSFDEEFMNKLKEHSEIYFLDDYLSTHLFSKTTYLLKLIPKKFNKKLKNVFEHIDHIHLPDFNSVLFFNKFSEYTKDKSFSLGCYHINEYNFKNNTNWYFSKKIHAYINRIPSSNFIFFNEISKRVYCKIFQRDFSDSILTSIGVYQNNTNSYYGAQTNRIVSIGRLISWKTYTSHIIDTIKELQKEGINLYFDSYGDGEEKSNLEKKVVDLELSEFVKFNKEIPYQSFKDVVKNNLLFIGAGTSLIEASSLGIPSLIGIENNPNNTSYGFLHDTKGYSYQEKQLNLQERKMSFFIKKLLEMDDKEYKNECKKAKERAKDFSIDITVDSFIKLVLQSSNSEFYFTRLEILGILSFMFLNKILKPKTNYSKRL